MQPRVLSEETIASGRWLELKSLVCSGPSGKEHTWEYVNRRNSRGAAALIATLHPSGRILLVRQFRPPAGGYVIEFPAGLVDIGETPESTALRELKEETGYTGVVAKTAPASLSSPGLSAEKVNIVVMDVDENAPENATLSTNFDENEHIETFAVRLDELGSFLTERLKAGDLMDAKVIAFSSFAQVIGTTGNTNHD
ncbi:MAG: NUDIX hydrolase [Victivallales bacterium]|nr:NUDIX hydrolase [Victivallales bacterium]